MNDNPAEDLRQPANIEDAPHSDGGEFDGDTLAETKKPGMPSCMRCGHQLKHGEPVCEVRKGIVSTCCMHGFDFIGQEHEGWNFISPAYVCQDCCQRAESSRR